MENNINHFKYGLILNGKLRKSMIDVLPNGDMKILIKFKGEDKYVPSRSVEFYSEKQLTYAEVLAMFGGTWNLHDHTIYGDFKDKKRYYKLSDKDKEIALLFFNHTNRSQPDDDFDNSNWDSFVKAYNKEANEFGYIL